ncbi:Betaine--homocysteine S-methyltransferase 1 [Holothuria leucospilota]|uniref:Betaine--homocysteine S-methyltransferase 1 n=1 Tax=Holothuria leucospilota TaxID=206669 RepID=A0A9Q0YKC9_HOLLE|nr:Betaine--homocysteine S-methyltransferase 1 [Holothuria leucospilota]
MVSVVRTSLRLKSNFPSSLLRVAAHFSSSSANRQDAKRGLLERLANGPVIGDGSFVITLEKRGYVEAGAWTPEAVLQYPEAVKQLHREFLRAGSDVMQTFTFYSSDDKLCLSGDNLDKTETINCENLNNVACDLAKEVANEGDALVAGGISPVPGYVEEKGKEFVMSEFNKQMKVFKEKGVDFVLAEFFAHIEETEWAIEAMRQLDIPIACSMRIGPAGDLSGVTPQECAVRMAKAGADVVGINCNYDPFICLDTMKMMKEALEEAGITSCHLMAQPVGWHTHELRDDVRGYTALPEFPFSMEPRLLTRTDASKFAREAFNLGVRYIGGCCGFEPYHIRAIAEELAPERGVFPPGKDKSEGYASLKKSVFKRQWERGSRQYWEDLIPAAGREKVKLLAQLDESE